LCSAQKSMKNVKNVKPSLRTVSGSEAAHSFLLRT